MDNKFHLTGALLIHISTGAFVKRAGTIAFPGYYD